MPVIFICVVVIVAEEGKGDAEHEGNDEEYLHPSLLAAAAPLVGLCVGVRVYVNSILVRLVVLRSSSYVFCCVVRMLVVLKINVCFVHSICFFIFYAVNVY